MPLPRRAASAIVTTCRLACAAAVLLSAGPAISAQTTANPPKLQKQLQKIADVFTRKDVGPVIQTGATVGERMITIHFEPAPGIAAEIALGGMRQTDWTKGICANKDALQFLNNEAVTVRISLSQSDAPPITISDVTATSCAQEGANEARVSRMISGVAFGPKPSRDEAMILIEAYLKTRLLDFDTARIECSDVGEAGWIKPTLEPRRYGYFMRCNVNAKNAFGGYVGFEEKWFRFNDDEFEELEYLPGKNGLMEPSE